MLYICKLCDVQFLETFSGILVCKNCQHFNDVICKYEIVIPKELINIITYYLNIEDTINFYKSGVYNYIKTKNYWINKIQFILPNIKKYIIYEVIMYLHNFSDLLTMLYCKDIDQFIYINYKLIVNYGHNILKEKRAEVTYYIHTPIHDGFCCVELNGEDIDETTIIYYVPILSDFTDEYIFEKESDRCGKDYGRCNGEITYEIKSIKYIIL
jgi:hypothetical protein